MRLRQAFSPAIAVVALSSLIGVGNPAHAIVACADASLQGCWSVPFSPFGEFDGAPPQTPVDSQKYPTAVSIAVTPSGGLVYWDGLSGIENGTQPMAVDASNQATNSRSYALDLGGATPFWTEPLNRRGGGNDDMFCADQRLLDNGRVIVAGGTRWANEVDLTANGGPKAITELFGSKETRLYSEGGDAGGAFNREATRDMKYGRWYPTLTTLPSGKLLIAGGVGKLLYNNTGTNVNQTETYDPVSDTWTENGFRLESTLPLFARMHLLPNGEIFFASTGQMYSPAGESVDQALWNVHKAYNPVTNSWRTYGLPAVGARSSAFQVQLPLKPPYNKAEFLIGGGTVGMTPSSYIGTNLSEKVTVGDADGDGAWESSSALTSGMVNRRWYSSGVALPNGHVIALSGADKDEVIMPSIELPVRQAELWDGEKWTGLSLGGRDRSYHNSAILLADGSILVGGHSPINNFYGDKGDGTHDDKGFTNNLKDPSFERFYPPYLFNGERPDVVWSFGEQTWGATLPVALRTSGAAPAKFVLSRLPSTTHTTDADQRTVEVSVSGSHTENGNTVYGLSIPTNRAVAPPGYYYVFALSDTGVPSVATIVRITDDPSFRLASPVALGDTTLR